MELTLEPSSRQKLRYFGRLIRRKEDLGKFETSEDFFNGFDQNANSDMDNKRLRWSQTEMRNLLGTGIKATLAMPHKRDWWHCVPALGIYGTLNLRVMI